MSTTVMIRIYDLPLLFPFNFPLHSFRSIFFSYSESFFRGINWFNSNNNPISVLLDETDEAPSDRAENANIYSHIFEANYGLMLTIAFLLALLYFVGLLLEKERDYPTLKSVALKLLKIFVLASELPILISILL